MTWFVQAMNGNWCYWNSRAVLADLGIIFTRECYIVKARHPWYINFASIDQCSIPHHLFVLLWENTKYYLLYSYFILLTYFIVLYDIGYKLLCIIQKQENQRIKFVVLHIRVITNMHSNVSESSLVLHFFLILFFPNNLNCPGTSHMARMA